MSDPLNHFINSSLLTLKSIFILRIIWVSEAACGLGGLHSLGQRYILIVLSWFWWPWQCGTQDYVTCVIIVPSTTVEVHVAEFLLHICW